MSKKWTEDEMKYLTNNWSDKTKRPAVAKQLGRSVGACSAKLRAINKAQKETKPPWVKAAEKVVTKQTETIDIVEDIPYKGLATIHKDNNKTPEWITYVMVGVGIVILAYWWYIQ
jgi:hypothetical protein